MTTAGQGDEARPPVPPGVTYPPVSSRNDLGTLAVVTGVVGILGCLPLVFSIIAIMFGRRGLAAAARGLATNPGTARAGVVLGVVGLVLWGLVMVVLTGYAITHTPGT